MRPIDCYKRDQSWIIQQIRERAKPPEGLRSSAEIEKAREEFYSSKFNSQFLRPGKVVQADVQFARYQIKKGATLKRALFAKIKKV